MGLYVVEMTPALRAEMKKKHIRFHFWRGYVVIDYDNYGMVRWQEEADRDRLLMLVNPNISPELRYLLDPAYQQAIRNLQENENVE